jgi:hypothetical protein
MLLEKLIVPQLVKKFSLVMEPCSQEHLPLFFILRHRTHLNLWQEEYGGWRNFTMGTV